MYMYDIVLVGGPQWLRRVKVSSRHWLAPRCLYVTVLGTVLDPDQVAAWALEDSPLALESWAYTFEGTSITTRCARYVLAMRPGGIEQVRRRRFWPWCAAKARYHRIPVTAALPPWLLLRQWRHARSHHVACRRRPRRR
jgi:hypothetical protein